ncbi:MAG: hypothetical protein WCZ15_00200 [Patescibacteria group bacterium]
MSDHLEFDTDFLETKRGESSHKSKTNPQTNIKNNSHPSGGSGKKKLTLWLLAIIGFFVIIFLSSIFDDNSTTSSNSNSLGTKPIQTTKPTTSPSSDNPFLSNFANDDEEYVIVGEYSCSIYHANKADEIQPSKLSESLLDSRRTELENRADELDRLSAEIKNTYVNEYSQWSIDNYNSKVDSYNVKFFVYEADVEKFENDIDAYNIKVNKYNNYLENNCTKVK